MKLADWLSENNVRRNAFARQIGVSASLITLLCDEKTWPSHDVAQAIERETGGAVMANDFLRRPSRAPADEQPESAT